MNQSIQFMLQVVTDFANTLPPSARGIFQQTAQAHLQELNKFTPEVMKANEKKAEVAHGE